MAPQCQAISPIHDITPLTILKQTCYFILQAPTLYVGPIQEMDQRSPMSRMATTSARRNRAVWDRPATDTRLPLWPRPIPVSLGNPLDPLRKSIVVSAPSRPTFPQRNRAADARVPSPRMITHGSYPQRACPTTVDARVLSRMISRPALIGAEADACGIAPRMISHAPALDAAARATKGALANLILTLSPSPFRHFRPLPRGACSPKADHSGLRAGIHPLTSSLSSSRDDRPVALGVGAPNGAPTPLSPYTKGPA